MRRELWRKVPRRAVAVAGAVAIAAGAVALWWRRSPTPPPETPVEASGAGTAARPLVPAPREDFVGSPECAACHADIARVYHRRPMARSIAPVATAEPVEDVAVSHEFDTARHRRYRVERQGARVFHHELLVPPGEETPLADHRVEVGYAVGSGRQGRSYLIERDGLFFQSPITWYPARGAWGLSPGYRPEGHLGFEREVGDACLACHAGRARPVSSDIDNFGDPPFREQAIGCENCHGPGGRHVAKQTESPTAGGSDDTIVNPARLTAQEREHVCAQCHLQGVERIPRYGRTFHDFRPGNLLDDVLCIFVNETGSGQGAPRIVDHVSEMRASRCYSESGGRLGCTSCHDPHVAAPEGAPERADFYQRACLACHTGQSCALPEGEQQSPPANGSCVACHMPLREATDVPHQARSDHRLPRRPGAARFQADGPAQLVLFDGAAARLPEWEQDRARGLQLVSQAAAVFQSSGQLRPGTEAVALATRGERLLRQALAAAHGNDAPAGNQLGVACQLLGRPADAVAAWRNVLALYPDRAETLACLGGLACELHDAETGVACFERLFTMNPWHARLYRQQAGMLAQKGETERAIRAAEQAMALDPGDPLARQWLVLAYQQSGRAEQATAQLRFLERWRKLPAERPGAAGLR